VDADRVAREITAGPGAVMDRLVDIAGEAIVEPSGGLDRAALAERLFDDLKLRSRVEDVLHPAIREAIGARFRAVETMDPDAVVVVEAALLVETGRQFSTDALVVVEAPRALKLARQIARDARSTEAARARLDAQASIGTKVLAADLVIWNDGTQSELFARSTEVWHVLARWSTERKPS
jgi:dephospho-CoA kinase